jgi:hypothetical protein
VDTASEGEEGEEHSKARDLAGGCLFDFLSGCALDGCLTLAVPSVVIALFLFLK